MARIRVPSTAEVATAGRDPRLRRALAQPVTNEGWRSVAACRGADPEIFFPQVNEPADAAVAVCRTCPVQSACLAWALQVEDRHGIWGSTTPRERLAMLVIWRARRDPTPGLVWPRGGAAGGRVRAAGGRSGRRPRRVGPR